MGISITEYSYLSNKRVYLLIVYKKKKIFSTRKFSSNKVNSVQEPCTKCFLLHILKFEILQTTWKNKTKNIKMLDLLVKKWKQRVWCSLFNFFMWFARFQILICEPQSIWHKLLVLSLLWNKTDIPLLVFYLPVYSSLHVY